VNMHRWMLDRDVRNLGNIRISLAECYFKMGKFEKADSLFKDWLAVEPDWGAGWIGWSDLYWLWNLGAEKDFNKAEKILNHGLKIPNVNDRDFIKERLQDLKAEKEKNVSPKMPRKIKNKLAAIIHNKSDSEYYFEEHCSYLSGNMYAKIYERCL
jgi:tetratricopeptide (TPR) repeat protein